MKLSSSVLMLVLGIASGAAGQRSEFATGRAYYADGEFKKAVAHFQLALQVNPNDAEVHYWLGMSYQVLADIASPFDHKYNSRARLHLTKATELAPSRPDYRRELFDCLVDSAGSSRAAWRQAAGILRTVSESDPDYLYMCRRLTHERKVNSAAEARLARLFLVLPRAAYRVAELPVSALSR